MKTEALNQWVLFLAKNIEFISGKWFNRNDKSEIKSIEPFIAKIVGTYNKTEIDALVNGLVIYYGDSTTSLWYPLQFDFVEGVPSSPFPLDKKQYMILNRLLFHPEDEVIFITTGVGGSGKSTFMNIVKQLFDNDYSPASLSDLTNEFTVAEAVKHRLICSDELAKGELDLPILKTLASKQSIFVNPKGRTGYNVKTQSALFYCCNKPPKIDITDTGILRRIVFYERNTKITNPDPTMQGRIYTKEELNAFATIAKLAEIPNWKDYFKIETRFYLMKDNSVFICKSNDYYNYCDKCRDANLKAYSEPKWEEINALFNDWLKDLRK